ncbi:MAG: DUF1517 domain-containing protein [Kofleriaceae bacterium]
MRTWWTAVIVMLVASVAVADTGGSMGGGDWGGGGGGGGDYSSSSSSYSSSDSSSYSYSSSDSGGSYSSGSGGGGEASVPVIMLMVVGMVAFFGFQAFAEARHNRDRALLSTHAYGGSGFDTVDVSVLRIAIDGRARKYIQSQLGAIAKVANTATAVGRHAMLREVTLMLRRVRDAWVYGGAVNEAMLPIQSAKVLFDRHVDNTRSRFTHETIRNADGATTTQRAPDATPRAEEGEGLILVSIVVAARTELFTVAHIGDGEDLRKALEAASYRSPSDLVAIEIIWQPSDADDRMSSIELEAKYPHPQLIPIGNALVGKTFCAYCSGPFPAELVTCPHCGAPARGTDRAA